MSATFLLGLQHSILQDCELLRNVSNDLCHKREGDDDSGAKASHVGSMQRQEQVPHPLRRAPVCKGHSVLALQVGLRVVWRLSSRVVILLQPVCTSKSCFRNTLSHPGSDPFPDSTEGSGSLLFLSVPGGYLRPG